MTMIQDPKNPNWAYYATQKGDQVQVNHRAINPVPGMLGSAGTLQMMSNAEFAQFVKDNQADINLQRTPAQDAFVPSAVK